MKEIEVLTQFLNTKLKEESFRCDFSDINSERLLDLTMSHHIVPSLTNQLEEVSSIQPEFKERLCCKHRKISKRSLKLTNELHILLDRFQESGLRVIPYKGPVLSQVLHGDINNRQYEDIDILVPPHKFDNATHILEEQGYESIEHLRGLGEVVFRNDSGAIIDLHRQLLPRIHPGKLDFDDLWARSERIKLHGRTVSVLDDADRIIMLSVHGAKHCWYRLGWLHDFAAITSDWTADSAKLRQRARDVHADRHIQLGHWLAKQIYAYPNQPVGQNSSDFENPVMSSGRRLATRLKTGEATPPTDREQIEIQWRLLPDTQAKAKFGFNLATIPSQADIESINLPAPFEPLYRFVRPTRMAARLARKLVN